MDITSMRLAALALIAATSIFAADPSISPPLASIADGHGYSSADLEIRTEKQKNKKQQKNDNE
jgi:hypothetical protein